ncbi:hypothetical protein LINPERHAP1_LOCUS30080 [Linum perenne]
MDVKRKALQTLVTKLGSILKRTRSEALSELRIITKHDAESRPIDIEAGSNPYLAEILYSSSQDSQILLLQILSQFIKFIYLLALKVIRSPELDDFGAWKMIPDLIVLALYVLSKENHFLCELALVSGAFFLEDLRRGSAVQDPGVGELRSSVFWRSPMARLPRSREAPLDRCVPFSSFFADYLGGSNLIRRSVLLWVSSCRGLRWCVTGR